MFGAVIPERPVMTDFKPVAQNKWVLPIDASVPVHDIVVFLQPNAPQLPGNAGLSLYLSDNGQKFAIFFLTNFASWEFVGFLLPQKPSAFVHVPQTLDKAPVQPNMFLPQQMTPKANQLFLLVALESLDTIKNVAGLELTQKQNFANQIMQLTKYIAKDLFNFMASFAKSTPQHDVLIVPTNVIDRWITRFTDKLKVDPYFWKHVKNWNL